MSYASLIKDVGFPIIVALILLYQIPPLAVAIEKLSTTLTQLNISFREQATELRQHRDMTERRRTRETEEE